MSWNYPANPNSVTGNQTLTREKPITFILRSLKELQDNVAVDVQLTIGDVVFATRKTGNKIVLDGDINFPASSVSGLPDVTSAQKRLTLVVSDDGYWEVGEIRAI